MVLIPGTVRPDYAGGGILNLISSIQSHFGLKSKHDPLHAPIPFQKKAVLLIVDGLGFEQLERHRQQGDLGAADHFQEVRRLTSVFPSTTMAALTTLHMGAPPAETGWLSGCLWLQELGTIVNLIRNKDEFTRQGVDLGFMRKTRSIYSRLDEARVRSTIIFPEAFEGSFLSNWHHEGSHQQGYAFTPSTIPTLVQNALQHSDYVVIYYPHYDDMCHRYGPESQEARDEARLLNTILGGVMHRLPPHTTLMLTADHGHKTISGNIWLDGHLDLHPHLLRPVSGDKVSRYVDVKPGHEAEVQAYLSRWADVVSSHQLWEEGYFGGDPADLQFLTRTGTLMAHARDDMELNWSYHPEVLQIKGWKGNHGGLSSTEMWVPLGIFNS
ncbi:alkaline phosphatase family protein [Deinococcus cellulosilyticus]|nr:alkaline phosphatase family protein [Deinococcus cellulosilyticus]